MTTPESYAARLRETRAHLGISQAELGRRWGVSDRMVRKLEAGQVPESYRRSIDQLARGVAAPPARRTTAGGELARVRSREGSIRPELPPPVPARGQFGVQVGFTPGGARAVVVTAPRTQGVGREQARAAILDEARRAARGRRARGGRGQRLRFVVRSADGRTFEIGRKGGYDPSTALRQMRGEGDDPFTWLSDVLDGMGYDVAARSIVGVTMSYGG